MIQPEIIKEKRKSISLQIKNKETIILKAPLFVSSKDINQFIKEKQPWIKKQLKKITLTENAMPLPFKDYQQLLYLGKSYQITPTKAPLMHPLTFTEEHMLYNKLSENTHEYIKKHLKNIAKEILLDQTDQLSKKTKLYPNHCRVKSQTSRWGSCSSQKNINLNWKLIHTPLSVINYVIIHELVHLEHMNHSKIFWDSVKTHCPNYKDEKKWLLENGNFVTYKY